MGVIIPSFQTRRGELREIKQLAQSHIAAKWLRQSLSPGLTGPTVQVTWAGWSSEHQEGCKLQGEEHSEHEETRLIHSLAQHMRAEHLHQV